MSYDIKINTDFNEAFKQLLTSFCNIFPTHYIDYLGKYREQYCTDVYQIYKDFQQLEINSQSSQVGIVHETYFQKFCSNMELIVGEAPVSQHFLMFILSSNMTAWSFYIKEDENKQLFFTLKGGHFDKDLVSLQLSLLSALFESSLLSYIYPHIDTPTTRLEGELFIPLYREGKEMNFSKITLSHGIINHKQATVELLHQYADAMNGTEDNISWTTSILDFSYFHKPFDWNDLQDKQQGGFAEFGLNSIYGEQQKEVLSLFEFNKLRKTLPLQEKNSFKNKI